MQSSNDTESHNSPAARSGALRVRGEESLHGGRVGFAGSIGCPPSGHARVSAALSFGAARFAGWARTIQLLGYLPHHRPIRTRIEIEAVDSLLPGEVAVVGTQKSIRNAPWGELLSTASRARGARGAIVDGLVRDVQKIEELGFPVFACGHQAGGFHGPRHASRLTTFRWSAAR